MTPDNADTEELPAGVRTRITLLLLNEVGFEQLANDLQAIPDTLLLFLRQLQRLTIKIHFDNENVTAEEYSKRETEEKGLYTALLTKTTGNQGKPLSKEKKYYTVKSDLKDLPEDSARKDKNGRNIDRATVVLAFPVDEKDSPILEPQYTFAFLPLRRVGFKFLIQSDFVTQANREDVMFTNRNKEILKGVAEAFQKAMSYFCDHSSLRYEWMRYLPDDSIIDDFWRQLWPLIRIRLEQTPLLEPFSGKGLCRPNALQRLTQDMCDSSGNPLLPDLRDEVYLSRRYLEKDFGSLQRLGTRELSWSNIIARLVADLGNQTNSRWKNMEELGDWRTRICSMLLKPFLENSLGDIQERLRRLELIPLHDNTWRSPISSKIYLPRSGSVPIPDDLGLNLVHASAVDNAALQKLLTQLKIVQCPTQTVLDSIHARYAATKGPGFKLLGCVSHIRYLYWHLPKDTKSLHSSIRFVSHDNKFLCPKESPLYFPDLSDEYSPAALFRKSGQLPGCEVQFLHGEYVRAVDETVFHNGHTWRKWLEQVAGIRWAPPLYTRKSIELSMEFEYIFDHKSDILLELMKLHWQYYKAQMENEDFLKAFKDRRVLQEDKKTRLMLSTSYLPFPRLKQIIADLQISSSFHFILMSKRLQDDDRNFWSFVEKFHVRLDDDARFYLFAINSFKDANPKFDAELLPTNLSTIYSRLQAKSNDKDPTLIR